ncbi:uncharacterized protein TNCV_1655131 [Trichonephila clavipes]|nr:uncharacterized protein TNCV_1655131 [Trichonephila clavipes]
MCRQHVVKWCRSFQSGKRDVKHCNMAGSSRPSSSMTVIPHSPYLAPRDYFLFPRLKEHLSGKRFSSNSAVKTSAEIWLNGQGPHFYLDGLSKLYLRSDKCLGRLGDYVKK